MKPTIELGVVSDTKELSHFTHLKTKTLAEYSILYHKNVGYQVNSLDRIISHEAILFKKFENTTQQANLFLEYTSLPIILADLAICVLQGKVKYLKDYPKAAHYRMMTKEEENELIYTNVLKRLLLKFLTSDIAQKKPWNGETDFRRIFYFKQPNSDIQFYPHLLFNELTTLLFETTTLKINSSRSKVGSRTVKLYLELRTAAL